LTSTINPALIAAGSPASEELDSELELELDSELALDSELDSELLTTELELATELELTTELELDFDLEPPPQAVRKKLRSTSVTHKKVFFIVRSPC
jgi:hypothetical protein